MGAFLLNGLWRSMLIYAQEENFRKGLTGMTGTAGMHQHYPVHAGAGSPSPLKAGLMDGPPGLQVFLRSQWDSWNLCKNLIAWRKGRCLTLFCSGVASKEIYHGHFCDSIFTWPVLAVIKVSLFLRKCLETRFNQNSEFRVIFKTNLFSNTHEMF